MNAQIKHRLNYIIRSADLFNKKPQDVSMVIRVTHNLVQFGQDGSPEFVKKNNLNISRKALDLLVSSDWKTFHKNTVNEHELPINDIWNYVKTFDVKNASPDIYFKELHDLFENHPMVTVTKEEDNQLRNVKTVTNRYESAGIEKIKLDVPTYEYFKELKVKNNG